MLKPLPHVLRPKRFGSSLKTSGHYKRKQISYCEKSKLQSEGTYLITMPNSYTIEIWDINTKLLLKTLTSHSSPIVSIQYTPDLDFVLSFCQHSILHIWKMDNGNLCLTLENIPQVPPIVSRGLLCFIDSNNCAVVGNPEKGTHTVLSKRHILLLTLKRKIRMK
jgi:WD40 repeat protein